MSHVRFNQIFIALLLLSAFGAFALPAGSIGLFRGALDNLFFPVAQPLRRVAASISSRMQRPPASEFPDLAAPHDPAAEIQRLREQLASLSIQLEDLQRLNANRELVGNVRRYSLPFRALGDVGRRDALLLATSPEDGVSPGMPVLHGENLVGRILSVGHASARVQLVTDPGMRLTAEFRRAQPGADGKAGVLARIPTPQPLLEGRGAGLIAVTNLKKAEVDAARLKPGDWVLLRDEDWMPIVQGRVIGRIVRIDEWAKYRLFAEITIKPQVDLLQLSEAMVVVGRPVVPADAPAEKAAAPAPAPPRKAPARPAPSAPRQVKRP